MHIRTVSFRTTMFNTSQPLPHVISLGNYGANVVGWLKQGLEATTSFTVTELNQEEDNVWVVLVRINNADYSVGVALPEKAKKPSFDPSEWRIDVAYNGGCAWILRGIVRASRPYREEDMLALTDAVERMLRAEPQITDIKWAVKAER